MKIAFVGVGKYGRAALGGLFSQPDFDIRLVITDERSNEVGVSELSRSHEIEPVFTHNLDCPTILSALDDFAPEIIVSTNWRSKIPASFFSRARIATLNVHDALLPLYAGLSAEQWVILEGERETGVTVHVLTDDMDAGPIVCQRRFTLTDNITAAEVAEKQISIYPDIIVEAVRRLKKGQKPIAISRGRYRRYHALGREDARLDFRLSPRIIERQMRAWAGAYGGCWIQVADTRYVVTETSWPGTALCGLPGRVLTVNLEGVHVVTTACPESGSSGIIVTKLIDERGSEVFASSLIRRGHQFSA